ncbi:ABC transporter ATP-binding protein [Furfurilactobacillus entadae]|uniref:ABC transporter ATP-binding protein n=1 Tax=Furfurilactobacillus entadae TaxID=2922307 RepID=UPI0035E96CC0
MDVTFKQVSLAYDNHHHILNQISFTIPEGQLTCLLGPSGCGKSTTLNLISGLLQPTAGQIYFGDQDVTHHDALARKVGMVFQNYALYPHMTVLDNICFPMKMMKMPKAARLARAHELAALVHLTDELDKHPGELSGGQQQRVAIARALAKSPSILLLDEPLSNLDARLRVEMREEIRRIQQETGITTVFVTHDQEEATHIADQIMVLNEGAIQQFTTPNRLYEQPANLFVARFIGAPIINTLPLADAQHDLAGHIPEAILKAGRTLAVRAESLVPVQPGTHDIVLNGTHLATHQFGREIMTRINYAGDDLISTSFPADLHNRSQQSFAFALALTGTFIFDQTDQRIWPPVQSATITPFSTREATGA